MGVRQPRVAHQPDAEPGYEWLYEMPLPGTRGDVAICGTATTRAEAEAELARLCREYGVANPKRCTCPDLPGVDWHDHGCPIGIPYPKVTTEGGKS